MHEVFAGVMSFKAADALMLEKAIQYVNEVRATRRFKVLVEHTVQVMWLSTKPYTTADLVLYTADELHVFDLKTGKIPVQAYENEQLLYYAQTYRPVAPRAKGVTVHIVQPWADVMESWFIPNARLDMFEVDAVAAEQAILAGSTQFTPGDHCMFCPANPHSRAAKGKPYCPTMMGLLYPQPVPDYDEMMR
jgi:hypothetical protein